MQRGWAGTPILTAPVLAKEEEEVPARYIARHMHQITRDASRTLISSLMDRYIPLVIIRIILNNEEI